MGRMGRREFLGLAAAMAAVPAWPSGGRRVLIESIGPYRVMEPMFEGVRLVVNSRGDRYSPAYIQGVSGAAFRVAGICPCAPTCSTQMSPPDLVRLLGYEAKEFILGWKDDLEQAKAKVPEFVAGVKAELDRGRAVLVWHAFTTTEWDVVAGYGDSEGVFLGRGSYAGLDDWAKAKQDRAVEAVEICPAFGSLIVGEKVGRLAAREAEVAALKAAVAHARSAPVNNLKQGLDAYGRWVEAWEQSETKRGAGDSYCLGVYRTTHRMAGLFLGEVAHRHPAAEATLRRAADAFAAEADALDRLGPWLGWSAPESDPARNALAAPVLRLARDRYAEGIDRIEEALAAGL